jgi:hypothetical protein
MEEAEVAGIKQYIGYAAVILTALFLGRWYAKERDRLMSQGEPWIKSWMTAPGVTILIILAVLIYLKVKYS